MDNQLELRVVRKKDAARMLAELRRGDKVYLLKKALYDLHVDDI